MFTCCSLSRIQLVDCLPNLFTAQILFNAKPAGNELLILLPLENHFQYEMTPIQRLFAGWRRCICSHLSLNWKPYRNRSRRSQMYPRRIHSHFDGWLFRNYFIFLRFSPSRWQTFEKAGCLKEGKPNTLRSQLRMLSWSSASNQTTNGSFSDRTLSWKEWKKLWHHIQLMLRKFWWGKNRFARLSTDAKITRAKCRERIWTLQKLAES